MRSTAIKCEHKNPKQLCIECKGSGICEHSKARIYCHACRPKCRHKMILTLCDVCRGRLNCIHRVMRRNCNICKAKVLIDLTQENEDDLWEGLDLNAPIIETAPRQTYAIDLTSPATNSSILSTEGREIVTRSTEKTRDSRYMMKTSRAARFNDSDDGTYSDPSSEELSEEIFTVPSRSLQSDPVQAIVIHMNVNTPKRQQIGTRGVVKPRYKLRR